MTFGFASYEPASQCVGHSEPGASALMAFCLDMFEFVSSMGIYSCRNVVGGDTLSHHAEGRALDIGVPPLNTTTANAEKGMLVVEALGSSGGRIGVDHVIYDRKIWSAVTPGGRPYTGTHPHYDHVHAGLTRAAGANLTYATVVAVIEDITGAHTTAEEDDLLGFDIGRKGEPAVTGGRAKALQFMLIDRGFALHQHGADGRAGDETREALHRFKVKAGIAGEQGESPGLIGPHTYANLFRP